MTVIVQPMSSEYLLQKPLMPELTVIVDLVVILDGIDVDKIKAFAQTRGAG